MPLDPSIRPTVLRKEGDDRLVIDWSDGATMCYTWQQLRDHCPCAGCREERQKPPDPFRVLKPSELVPLKPVSITPMGHYAYKIAWSDGHDTGLFSLELLRELGEKVKGS
ncbi:MAG: DUF971 domain-containing protein [Gemmataceae bacterium]|nr:DUF971 domain-containing protein [Gemmataceae bacterium]MCI0742404.1 DUF971 domain-containing protein [Gemmataceae bacterium]